MARIVAEGLVPSPHSPASSPDPSLPPTPGERERLVKKLLLASFG